MMLSTTVKEYKIKGAYNLELVLGESLTLEEARVLAMFFLQRKNSTVTIFSGRFNREVARRTAQQWTLVDGSLVVKEYTTRY